MARIGFGRHGGSHGETEDDPLDGLVNLFDLGLVLAVAFLVAGLSIGASQKASSSAPSSAANATSPTSPRTVEVPRDGRTAQGQGAAVGTVYRLPDGTYVLDESAAAPAPTSP